MNKKRILTLCCMASLVAGLFGICESSNGNAKIKTLNVKKSFSVKMKVGETIRIKPKKAQADTIKFRSDNKKVATVNSKGYIKAKKTGNAKITAKNSTAQITGKIKVVKNNSIRAVATPSVEPDKNIVPTNTPCITQPLQTPDLSITNTPEPTSLVEPTVSPDNNDPRTYDLWLDFTIDQEDIYVDTTHLTGTMNPCWDCVLLIKHGNDIIKEIKLKDWESKLDFDVDFSEFQAGEEICLVLKFVGEQKPPIYVLNSHSGKIFTLKER